MFFLYERSGRFKVFKIFKIFASLQETEHSDLLSEHPGLFDTVVDRTGNPSSNIWNILQLSNTYVSYFTAHICSKYINK